jgi:hypothetical protein
MRNAWTKREVTILLLKFENCVNFSMLKFFRNWRVATQVDGLLILVGSTPHNRIRGMVC